MDRMSEQRRIVRDLINEYATHTPSRGDVMGEAIIDEEKGHYEVMFVGWDGSRRIHGTALHIDMIGDKIWIQHDGTSPGVAEELLEAGIERDSIVLGFRPAFVRQHTGFATG
jgi:hypothetical protein